MTEKEVSRRIAIVSLLVLAVMVFVGCLGLGSLGAFIGAKYHGAQIAILESEIKLTKAVCEKSLDENQNLKLAVSTLAQNINFNRGGKK